MNTSKFAKLCGVEKRTLFHYDEIGLLKPSRVRENGYREYAIEQLGMMDMIKIFQACGYTLSEIKRICEEDVPEKHSYINGAIERIEDQIDRLAQMKVYLQNKQQLFAEYHTLPVGNYWIDNVSLRFDREKVEPDTHFFSFLRDGTSAISMLDKEGIVYLCKPSPVGSFFREGRAISFFLEVPSEFPDLYTRIWNELESFQFPAELPFFMESLPHFLLRDQSLAVLKITAFQT